MVHLRDLGRTFVEELSRFSHLANIFEHLLCARPCEWRTTTMLPLLVEQTFWKLGIDHK